MSDPPRIFGSRIPEMEAEMSENLEELLPALKCGATAVEFSRAQFPAKIRVLTC